MKDLHFPAGRVGVLSAAFLLGTASLLTAAPGAPDAPMHGERGEASGQATICLSDIAQQGTRMARPRGPRPKGIRGPLSFPRDLPLPDGARVQMESRDVARALRSERLLSPAPAASFEALAGDPLVEPPDSHGAVGPNHLMVMLNSQVRVQDRTGQSLATLTLSDFWQALPGDENAPFDPRVAYDPSADRWITSAVGGAFRSLLVGVSRTGDPTGNWNLYRILTAPLLVDFPALGFNKDWIVVQGHIATPSPFHLSTRIWVFGKANLYAAGTGSFTSFSGEAEAIGGIPAVTLDPTVSTLYLVQNWSGNADGNGVLRLYTITGSLGSEVLTPVAFIGTSNPWASAPDADGRFCPQRGDPRRISCFGAGEVVFRNGTIWMAHLIFLPDETPTRNAIQWWQLAPDGAVLQRGRLEDATGVRFYGFPSLAVNRMGDMLVGFTSYSENQFASASYAFRAAEDPPGTLQPERLFKAGEDSYFRDPGHGGTIARWGDYSATVVDPINDRDFWTIQEYAAPKVPVTGESQWGTWWAQVAVEIPPAERTPPQPPAPPRTPRALPPRE